MSKKRPQEDSYQNQDQQNQEGQKNNNSGNEEDGDQQNKKFMCKCGKGYGLQSSLFNHIRIKHDDKKAEFAVERNVKPGRPKNTETTKDKAQKNPQKKEKKPDSVEENTWNLLLLFRQSLFKDLIINFRQEMRENTNQSDEDDQKIWKQFTDKKIELFKKIHLPQVDRDLIEERTITLQAWGKLLDAKHQLNIFLIFVSELILKFFSQLPNQKKDIMKQWVKENIDNKDNQYQQSISLRIRQILDAQYNEENNQAQAQNQNNNRQEQEEGSDLLDEDDDNNEDNDNDDDGDDDPEEDENQDDNDNDNDNQNANPQIENENQLRYHVSNNNEESKNEINNGQQYVHPTENSYQRFNYQNNEQVTYNNQQYLHDIQSNNVNNNNYQYNSNINQEGGFELDELMGQTNYDDDIQDNNQPISFLNQQVLQNSSFNYLSYLGRQTQNINFSNINASFYQNLDDNYYNNNNQNYHYDQQDQDYQQDQINFSN
ncbi:hypothetical protein ABPG74_003633 [Tetrahymena malaccensis]